MSLIVGRKYKNHFIVVGDTKTTDDLVGIENNQPEEGVIKSIIVNPNLLISFAGGSVDAQEALQAIGLGKSKKDVLRILQEKNIETNHNTEFIVCFGEPDIEMYSIKYGKIENTEATWIGSHPGFEIFQSHFLNPKNKGNKNEITSTLSFRINPTNINEIFAEHYSNMFDAMIEVIQDDSVKEVGGFIIPLLYDKKFKYTGYCHVYRRPIDKEELSEGIDVAISPLNAPEGTYSVNFSNSYISKLGAYFYEGKTGVIYERKDNGLMYPRIISNIDEIDFCDTYIDKFQMSIMVTRAHNLHNFLNKAIEMIDVKKFQKALNYLNRGIKIHSKKWMPRKDNVKEYLTLKSFIKDNKKCIIPANEINNLQIAFYHKGIANMQLKYPEEALLNLREALTLDSQNYHILIVEIQVLIDLNRLNEATNRLAKILELNKDCWFYYYRGAINARQNNFIKAEKDFYLALEENPNHTASKNGLEQIKRIRNKNES